MQNVTHRKSAPDMFALYALLMEAEQAEATGDYSDFDAFMQELEEEMA
ncbi:MAG: hypothetical protein FWB76_07200 [Oscillospiraceae bacterium]|nr:hypothetical protein [Oscillospiraceae bacterium]